MSVLDPWKIHQLKQLPLRKDEYEAFSQCLRLINGEPVNTFQSHTSADALRTITIVKVSSQCFAITLPYMMSSGGSNKIFSKAIHVNTQSQRISLISFVMNKYENYRTSELDIWDEIKYEWNKYIKTIGIVRIAPLKKYIILQELCLGDAFKVLQHYPGLLQRRPVLNLFIQLSHQLTYLHHRGIVHLDLKIENILIKFVSGELRAVIIDFELSKKTYELTTLVGTRYYWPPEYWEYLIAMDKSEFKINLKLSDIWSLGIVFGELLYPQEPAPWLAPKEEGSMDIFDQLDYDLNTFGYVFANAVNPLIEAMHCGYPLKDHDLASALIHDMLSPRPRRRPDAALVNKTCKYILNVEDACASTPQQSESD